jgi:uncharacterized RDD family membrane protein YckC
VRLPESGPGSIAPAGPRIGAFLVDAVLLVFAVAYFAFTVLFQQTPGMRLLKLRVVRLDRPAPIGTWRAAVRTLGVILLVPALVRDDQGRSLHDRLTGTAVVRV